jgi:hypothetical protein
MSVGVAELANASAIRVKHKDASSASELFLHFNLHILLYPACYKPVFLNIFCPFDFVL